VDTIIPPRPFLVFLKRPAQVALIAVALAGDSPAETAPPAMPSPLARYTLGFDTPVDPALQARVEAIDARLRAEHGMTADQTSVGVLDLNTLRLAMVRPDRIDYAASVPKIGILLAWFHLNPTAAANLDPAVRHELGLMIKASDNAIAAKYSQLVGLKPLQQVLDGYGLYDAAHGGGLWVGKHYGKGTERYGDPVGGHSHAATVRQLLRYYLLLEQGRLVSPAASATMREIFASPGIPHRDDKFVKGLSGRGVQLLRKAGWWENWFLDTAIVTGGGRHYVLVAMTHHPKGDDYLVAFAAAVDDFLK
jgi:beta-lactamase class A